jgi:hypothetical protein
LICLTRAQLVEWANDFAQHVSLNAILKIAKERLDAYQQVVQDEVLTGQVTTKNGNFLRKTLSHQP